MKRGPISAEELASDGEEDSGKRQRSAFADEVSAESQLENMLGASGFGGGGFGDQGYGGDQGGGFGGFGGAPGGGAFAAQEAFSASDGGGAFAGLMGRLGGGLGGPAAGGGMGGGGAMGGGFMGLAMDPNKPATTPMDFSRLGSDRPSEDVPVPRNMVEYLMTPEHRQIMTEESGADVDWAPEESKVQLRGSAEQIKRATRLLARVLMHCNWGRSEAKVRRLLRPRIIESCVCRLSPMNTLPTGQKTLSNSVPVISIGKDKSNDICIPAQIISRQHCILELDSERGAVYAIDCSTNGTFLNGVRLPQKQSGKVLVSHGDELLFQDPMTGDSEFGYIINLQELNVKPERKFEAPRRLLGPDESSSTGRDFA